MTAPSSTPVRTDYPDVGGPSTKWNGKDARAVSQRVNENTAAAAAAKDAATAAASAAAGAAAGAIPKSLGQAKGDIVVCTSPGVFSRIPKGSNGQALVYDDASPNGLRPGNVAADSAAPVDLGNSTMTVNADGFAVFTIGSTSNSKLVVNADGFAVFVPKDAA